MTTKLNWRNPTERPKQGEMIAVLYQHNKQHKPMSCEIMFGRYENFKAVEKDWGFVCSDDMTGKGSWGVYFGDKESFETPRAWMPWKEFSLPEWVPHNDHWGDVE